ncbi:MAG: hypothetical protein V5A47_11630 [Bacteroidales bacterium]
MSYEKDENNEKKDNNQRKKREIEKKYGAKFSNHSNLPPDIEAEWLKHIEKFEEQFNQGKRTTLWEFLGKPGFIPFNEIKASELTAELKRLTNIMNKKNIILDTICEVEDEELYRFITEELFNQEMDDIQIEGMVSHFIYEEFHPNPGLDIEEAYEYLLTSMMNKSEDVMNGGYDFLYLDDEKYVDSKGRKKEGELVKKKITDFLDSFDYFNLLMEEIKDIRINEEKTSAELDFYIHFDAYYGGTSGKMTFKGKGNFWLRPGEYGGWSIYHMNMPGIDI